MEDQRIKEILIEKNPEFKKLYLRHQKFEEDLSRIQNKKGGKASDGEIEEKNLKKKKLKIKDAMQQMIFEFKKNLD